MKREEMNILYENSGLAQNHNYENLEHLYHLFCLDIYGQVWKQVDVVTSELFDRWLHTKEI